MCFGNYGLRNKWLDKCLKKAVSGNRSTGNMVNQPKHCLSLNDSTFTRFIDHSEGN